MLFSPDMPCAKCNNITYDIQENGDLICLNCGHRHILNSGGSELTAQYINQLQNEKESSDEDEL